MAHIHALTADIVHDFVFSFTRNACIGDDHPHLDIVDEFEFATSEALRRTYVLPGGIGVHLLDDPVFQTRSEEVHERRSCIRYTQLAWFSIAKVQVLAYQE